MRATLLTSLAISAFAHPVWCQTITTEYERAVHGNFVVGGANFPANRNSTGTLTFEGGATGTFSQQSDSVAGFNNHHTSVDGTSNYLYRSFASEGTTVYAASFSDVTPTNLSFFQSLYGPDVVSATVTESYFIFEYLNPELYGGADGARLSFEFTDENGAVIPSADLEIQYFTGLGATETAPPFTGYAYDFTFTDIDPGSGETNNMVVRNVNGLIEGARLRNKGVGSSDPLDDNFDEMSVTFARAVEITTAPVPEPSSMVLGAAGLLVLMRRRR